jgi:hypothetical protein
MSFAVVISASFFAAIVFSKGYKYIGYQQFFSKIFNEL